MANCGNIAANFTLDCANPMKPGTGDFLYLFNWEDWQNATIVANSTNSLGIDSITLASGVTGYKIQGYTNTNRPQDDNANEGGRTQYIHRVSFFISDDSIDAIELQHDLNRGRYVAGLITNSQRIRIYGHGTGLISVPQTQGDYYANGGSIAIQLASDEEVPEAQPPKVFLGSASPYSFSTAKTEFEALIAA